MKADDAFLFLRELIEGSEEKIKELFEFQVIEFLCF
jgi:hypothetical protein